MGCKKSTCCAATGIVTSLLCIILGMLIFFLFPRFIDSQVRAQVKLYNGSATYDQWIKPPVPIYMQFWLFDVVNPDEVLNGERPSVTQKGPYTYREYRVKENVVFNTANDTVNYRERKWFVFQRDLSVGSENDSFTTVNLPVVVIAAQLHNWPPSLKWVVNQIVKLFDKTLFRRYTVHDLIWGYEDPLLAQVAKLAALVGQHVDDHVGLFYGKNNTDDGEYVMYTGLQDTARFADIRSWKNSSTLSFWSSKSANMINGTEGVQFAPFVKTSDRLFVFSSDLCRSINFVYNKPSSILGIDAMRFMPPSNLFANSTVNPDNSGFCIPNCLGSGVLNMSTCQAGIPAVMSQPHFYQGASKFIDDVVGMKPGPEFATVLDVESHTGVVLNAAKKLQVNIDLRPQPGFSDTAKLRPVFLPLLWLNESAKIDDAVASQLQNQLFLPLTVGKLVELVLLSLGVVGVILSAVLCGCSRSQKQVAQDRNGLIKHEVYHADDITPNVQVQNLSTGSRDSAIVNYG